MGSQAEFPFQAGRIDLDGRHLIDAESVDKRGAGETSDFSGFRLGNLTQLNTYNPSGIQSDGVAHAQPPANGGDPLRR